MTDIHMADVSEFQPNVDAPTYLKAGYQCIIARTHNGYRPDHMMVARRDYLRRFPFVAIGWYQYLAPDRDPHQQAREFINGLGGLRRNEYVICDAEEGAGRQVDRVRAWFSVVDAWAGFPAMLYTGESFLGSNLGGAAAWHGRPLWVAAYRRTEPHAPHTLWQHADNFHFPGITGGCDASVHHDTAFEYLSAVRSGKVPPHPAPPKPTPPKPKPKPSPTPPKPPEDAMDSPSAYLTHDNRLGFVLATNSGEVKYIEQQNAPGAKDEQGKPKNTDFWKDANSKPQWRSLGHP